MDKQILYELIRNILLILGAMLIFVGIGATYQASHDVNIMNNTLSHYANSEGIITDGISYYRVSKYNTTYDFFPDELLNRSLCIEYYGIGN
jgi:hypothetical protein